MKMEGDGDGGEEEEVWQSFRDAGFLDEASLMAKERQALASKVSSLENELYDYQYHMGILLIEKKQWLSEYEELRQAWEESQEILKREQAAHLVALYDVEKREENLKKALQIEKQCVADLEKALRETHGLASNIEEKSILLETKHSADAKFAEASHQGSDMDRKLKEVETHERAFENERQSFDAEKKMYEANLSREKRELRDWEQLLEERKVRQAEGCRVLNQREARANEHVLTLKQEDDNLKESHANMEMVNLTLRRKEDEIQVRSENLARKEENVNVMGKNLQMKEKELLALEEMLNAREQVGIQKAFTGKNTSIDLQSHEFELEIDQKRKCFDKELEGKVQSVEQEELRILLKEEKVRESEQALEKKLEKLKEKECDLETKWEALTEKENAIKIEKKNLEKNTKEMLNDKEMLQILNSELAKERADIDEKQLELHKQLESLRVSEEERKELQVLQSELKSEKEKCMLQEELLMKEYEVLRQDRENFEREWELLDEKRTEVTNAVKQSCQEKEKVESLRHSIEEGFKDEILVSREKLQQELESFRLEKESFEATMEHEKLVLSSKAQSEHQLTLHDLEKRKRELEVDMQNRLAKMENGLLEKEKTFKEEKERELEDIKHLREVVDKEMKEMNMERIKINKDKQDVNTSKQFLEGREQELQKDIYYLNILVKKLKDESEKFKEMLEKHNWCKNCGRVSKTILSGFKCLLDVEDKEVNSLLRLPKEYMKGSMEDNLVTPEKQTDTSRVVRFLDFSSSKGLRKCTSKILKASPFNMSEDTVSQGQAEVSPPSLVKVKVEEASKGFGDTVNEAEPYVGTASALFDVKIIQWDDSVKDVKDQSNPSVPGHRSSDSKAPEVQQDSQHSQLKTLKGPSKKGRPGGRRSRTVKAVEDAKGILGRAPEESSTTQSSRNAVDSICVNGGSQGDVTLADKGPETSGSKRQHVCTSGTTRSGKDPDGSENHSDGVATGGSRKRRQTISLVSETSGEKRYNLRPRKLGTLFMNK